MRNSWVFQDMFHITLSPVLARYDPFGVDVPLNFDNTHSLIYMYIS